jgi:alpha-amylase
MSSKTPPNICFYFQVHQPYRLKDLRVTEIGSMNGGYFDDETNRCIFRKVAEKCYLPANALIERMVKEHPGFTVAYSLSGVFLDQCREYGQDVLESFQRLAKTGRVEFLAETYYHSLSSLTSVGEFCEQVKKHADTVQELFGARPQVFRNTELVYCNEIAEIARLLGFKGILAEGADRVLHGRNPNVPYEPPAFRLPADTEKLVRSHGIHATAPEKIRVLLKNYRLSDDVAFRFGNRSWKNWPLSSDTFLDWTAFAEGHSVNLFMDYETFGEHQWADTGIFQFLEAFPAGLHGRGMQALTPSQTLAAWEHRPCETLDAHAHVSWADMERDLSAWRGNPLQEAAFVGVYALEQAVKRMKDPILTETWRKLQTSDHFYYLCTKYWSDGDVHKYFSPYESPYEAYRRYSHAIEDLRLTVARMQDLAAVGVSAAPKPRTKAKVRPSPKRRAVKKPAKRIRRSKKTSRNS